MLVGLIGLIAIVEFLVMGLIGNISGLSVQEKALFDTMILSATITPALYFLFFKPLRENLDSLQIAHRKIIEQQDAIEKSQELGQTGTWEVDFRNDTISGSAQACRIMGLPPGTPFDFQIFLTTVHPEDRRSVKFAWNRMLNGKPYDIEKRFIVNDSIKWLRTKVEMEFDEEGEPLRAIGFIQDITGFKSLQEKAIRAGQLASVGQISAMVAHEVNNPLSGISGYVEILLNKARNGSVEKDMLTRILKEVERITRIMKGFLTFTYDSGNSMSRQDVTPIIVDTLQLLAPQIEKKGFRLKIELDENLPQINCNPQQIEQVVLNIVRNAYQALQEVAHDDAELFIKIKSELGKLNEQPHIRLSISNNGPNIPSDRLSQIGKPFFTTKSAGVGTGLGLSISNDIMENHNGLLQILSEPGEPTEMNLYFPVDEMEESSVDAEVSSLTPEMKFHKVEIKKRRESFSPRRSGRDEEDATFPQHKH